MGDYLKKLLIKLVEIEVAVIFLRSSMQLKFWETLRWLKHHHSTHPQEHAYLVAIFLGVLTIMFSV